MVANRDVASEFLGPRVWEGMGCAKLVVVGPEIESVRQCLNARARVVFNSEKSPLPDDVHLKRQAAAKIVSPPGCDAQGRT